MVGGWRGDWVWEEYVGSVFEDGWLMFFSSLYLSLSGTLWGILHDTRNPSGVHIPTGLWTFVLIPTFHRIHPQHHLHPPPLHAYNTRHDPTQHIPLSGPLVKDNKTQPPPLPKLVAWVIKLAAFEFRYDGRPLVLGRGREGERKGRGIKEVGLVVPSRESRELK